MEGNEEMIGWERKPHYLLDYLLKTYKIRNDADLAKRLGVRPPHISKIRNRRMKMGAGLIIEIHEEFEISIKEVKEMLAQSGQDGY